jgi:predicted transcriptional regulator
MRGKRPGQSQRTAFLNVRIDPELKRKLEEEADKEERTVTYLVNTFIRHGLGCWQPPASTIIPKQ